MTTLISGCGMKPSKVVHVTCAKYHLKIFGHSKVNVGGGGSIFCGIPGLLFKDDYYVLNGLRQNF